MNDTSLDNLLKILLAGGSLTAGAFLTALRAKLANTKKKNWLHISFYILATVIIIASIITGFVFRSEIAKPNWYAIAVLTIAIISSVLLLWVTRKFLAGKHQYTIEELNPVVNAFSKNADKGNIKLLAGNLDFFGKSLSEIDCHPQYICLKGEDFRQIQILCTEPVTNEDRMRYGKIITDFETVQLRYYRPSSADLKVRGRIKTLNNVARLLIYNKVTPGRYEALELNTAETDGALYSHLWGLIWEIAKEPTPTELAEYRHLYRPKDQ
ncbi:hypothetical protein EXU57_24025 [Segetibacter sp. 3557_3]|uniref:hypothetical protein n=1 Tax=Segetibacter sp. 3557_3 TaxID=2547429 RepID=UPI00105853CA|nr:hypothetical protein [Segetibacter sp. 3557_3]TDH18249.1 hypothetical protein EXU57_24025 [Segetibacter sp. 3557_3]